MSTILLVEDNTDMRSLLRDLLEWCGHHVLDGRTGGEGLEALETAPNPPDLIISDVTMPEMDGIQFFERVRINPAWSNIRFYIMSANPHDERIQNALENGLDGLLPKPFSLDDLDKVVSKSA
jgi:CheY-like chemotaxis protein